MVNVSFSSAPSIPSQINEAGAGPNNPVKGNINNNNNHNTSSSKAVSSAAQTVETFAKLYPDLYKSLIKDLDLQQQQHHHHQQQQSHNINAKQDSNTEASDLASLFPSVLTADGLKNVDQKNNSNNNKSNSGSGKGNSNSNINNDKIAAELSEALSSALSFKEAEAKRVLNSESPKKKAYNDGGDGAINEVRSDSAIITDEEKATFNTAKNLIPINGKKNTACKGNHHHGRGAHAKELNKLLHQHYCGHKKVIIVMLRILTQLPVELFVR